MMSYYPLCCEKISRKLCQHPYVGKVSVDEKISVKFVYQFVKNSRFFTNNCVSNNYNTSLTAHYLFGTPTKFPNYGDFPHTFTMRTYGFDISLSPQYREPLHYYIPQSNYRNNENNLDLMFDEAVYPIRVSIYEIYNPGNVIKIWAENFDDKKWYLLWDGSPQIVPPTARLFSPNLRQCNFKTNLLRLTFKSSSRDYYTKLDAVMLIGTSELIFPSHFEDICVTNILQKINRMYSCHEDINNLTMYYKNAHLDIKHLQDYFHKYCICRSDIEKYLRTQDNFRYKMTFEKLLSNHMQQTLSIKESSHCEHAHLSKNSSKDMERIESSSDKSEELSNCNLSMLPTELLLKILENLDLITLCRLNQVNKHFNKLTLDPLLYTHLNVRNIVGRGIISDTTPTYISNIFCYFTSRCEYLQELDMTCSEFPVEELVQFLHDCGKHLIRLRLSRCWSINNFALLNIANICKNLKELDLSGCWHIENEGFLHLQNFTDLEHLRLGCTHIGTKTLCKILQKNQRIYELNLESLAVDLKKVIRTLKSSCQNLHIINLLSPYITSQNINTLADCKNLRKIHLSNISKSYDSWHNLFSSCQYLEEVHLANIYLTENNLKSLTQCKNLKRLHIDMEISEKYSVIFENCPKLEEFHMDKNRNSEQLSHTTIDSSVQDNTSEIDFDVTTTSSMASIVTHEEYSPLSASLQAASDIEHRYQLIGNINIINQLEVDQDVLCICYTETYDFLAAGLSDGNLKFYKISSGENTLVLCDTEMMQNPAPVTAVKHRPVHTSRPITRTVIATYANGCVKCWHYPTAQCLYTIRERRQTFGLAYHPQLPKFVTVGDDTNLYLYDEETKTRERVFRGSDMPDVVDGHKSRVFSACFNPRSAHELISAGWDDTIQFWDTRQAHSLRFISGVHMCGDGLDISRNGKEILTCAWQKNNPLQLWDYGSGKLIITLEPDSYSSLLYVGKYVTNTYIACGGCDTDLFRIVDLRSHSTIAMIKYLKGGVYSLDVGPSESKYSKRILPKLAFCAGTTIFEVDVQSS